MGGEGGEVQMTCPVCGIDYCLPERFHDERREDHKSWYCPNGHTLHFPGQSAKEKRIAQLERLVALKQNTIDWRERQLEARDHEVRSLRAKLAWAKRRAVA